MIRLENTITRPSQTTTRIGNCNNPTTPAMRASCGAPVCLKTQGKLIRHRTLEAATALLTEQRGLKASVAGSSLICAMQPVRTIMGRWPFRCGLSIITATAATAADILRLFAQYTDAEYLVGFRHCFRINPDPTRLGRIRHWRCDFSEPD